MPSQHRKHRGMASQRIVAEYLQANGWPFAESTGSGRSGSDITGTPFIDWEVKSTTRLDLPGTMRQLAERYKANTWPVAVIRPNGYGPARIGEWPAVMPLAELVALLREAGYGDSA